MIDLEAIRARAKQYELGAFESVSDFEFWGEKAAADINDLLAEVERLNDMVPGRWFRVRRPDGSLWCETSDGDEAREASKETGWPLERLFVSQCSEWRLA